MNGRLQFRADLPGPTRGTSGTLHAFAGRMKSLCFLSLFALVACSPSSSPSSASSSSSSSSGSVSDASSSLSGTVGGSTLAAASVVARYTTIATQTINGVKSSIRGLRILVSSKANTCSDYHFSGATMLDLAIRGDQVAPGTYTVIDPDKALQKPGEAEGDFNAVDGVCKDLVAESSLSGTITLTRTDGPVLGTLDITFKDGHVAGDFQADLCPDAQADAGAIGCTQ